MVRRFRSITFLSVFVFTCCCLAQDKYANDVSAKPKNLLKAFPETGLLNAGSRARWVAFVNRKSAELPEDAGISMSGSYLVVGEVGDALLDGVKSIDEMIKTYTGARDRLPAGDPGIARWNGSIKNSEDAKKTTLKRHAAMNAQQRFMNRYYMGAKLRAGLVIEWKKEAGTMTAEKLRAHVQARFKENARTRYESTAFEKLSYG